MAKVNQKSLEDALRDTICTYAEGQKSLAVDLDYSFSNWSQICGKLERFPFFKLPALMRITDNLECLHVLADHFGYRLEPKEVSVKFLVGRIANELNVEASVVAKAIEEFLTFNVRTGNPWRCDD